MKALLYYLDLLFLPYPLSAEHAFQVSEKVGWVHLAAMAVFLSLAWLAISRRSRWSLLALTSLLLPLVPVAVVPLNVLVNEHRLYFTLALGAAGLGSLLARTGLLEHRGQAGLLVGLLGVWGWQSAARTEVWQDELSLWRQALQVAPQMPRVHFLLAEAYRRQGDAVAAEHAYLEADRLFRGNAEVELNLGALYLEQGEREQARTVLEHLVHSWPGHPQALYNLGLVLEEEEPDKALELLGQAWQLRPDWPEAGLALASLYESRGELEQAKQVLEELVRRRPGSADAWSDLGQMWARAQEFGRARTAWEKALELEPEHPQARANLHLLQQMTR